MDREVGNWPIEEEWVAYDVERRTGDRSKTWREEVYAMHQYHFQALIAGSGWRLTLGAFGLAPLPSDTGFGMARLPKVGLPLHEGGWQGLAENDVDFARAFLWVVKQTLEDQPPELATVAPEM